MIFFTRCFFRRIILSKTSPRRISTPAMWRPTMPGGHRLAQSGPRYMVPLDFIGRIEHLADDLLELIDLAGFIHQQPILSPSRRRELEARLRGGAGGNGGRPREHGATNSDAGFRWNTRTAKGASLESQLRNASLDALVREAYAQDIACGFSRVP